MDEEHDEPRFDSWKLGTILGLVAPVASFLGYYLLYHRRIPFARFMDNLRLGSIFLPVLSLCVLPNLLIFFIFIWTKKDRSAKGVILATILYAIYVAIMKLL